MKETKYISKEYTNCMRGILAILVVLHHLYQYSGFVSNRYIGLILQTTGFLCVAMFFFYSGYGLLLSSRSEKYIDTFLRKRFIPLYSFYVVLIILYTLWTLLLEKHVSLSAVLQSFFIGDTVVTNGWYLQTTFLAYLLFYFCFRIFKKTITQISSFAIAILIYIIFCIYFRLGIHWYQTIPCMILGMIYCYKKNNIDAFLKKFSWLILGSQFILFSVCFLLSKSSGFDLIFSILYSILFVCFCITLSYILCDTPLISNKFFDLCGKYSLAIYVSHGFFLRLIKLGYIENKLLYIFVVIIGTVLTSIIIKKIHTSIIICFQKINKSV